MGIAVAAGRARVLLGLVALAVVPSTAWAAQAVAAAPAYVERGHQTETRQRTYHDRIERFYRALSEALQRSAPDLLATLAAPPPDIHGYQILPDVVADATPPPAGTRSQIVSYSWQWSDTLIERQMATLERLDTELARVPQSAAGRASFERLAADYRTVIADRTPIDADIQYNWLWQAQIAANRPLFDRLRNTQQAVLDREAIEAAMAAQDEAQLRAAAVKWGFDSTRGPASLRAALAGRAQSITGEIANATGWAAPPDFLRIEHPAPDQWLVTVPLYTDITDAGFVQSFQNAVETLWHTRAGGDEFRLRLAVETIPAEQLYCGRTATVKPVERCAAPARGAAIDLAAHVARFPAGGAVLTTGAATLQLTAGRAIVLGPHDVAPHVLAHEFGHILGFPDAYFRGYRDLGIGGFQVTELADLSDVMGAPGSGPVLARHFERLIAAREVQALMGTGLDALYQRNDPVEAAARFRDALARNPAHYGATLQLAKALDRAGKADESLALWKRVLEMAEAIQDAETIGTARARLATQMPRPAPAR